MIPYDFSYKGINADLGVIVLSLKRPTLSYVATTRSAENFAMIFWNLYYLKLDNYSFQKNVMTAVIKL